MTKLTRKEKRAINQAKFRAQRSRRTLRSSEPGEDIGNQRRLERERFIELDGCSYVLGDSGKVGVHYSYELGREGDYKGGFRDLVAARTWIRNRR